MLLFTLALIVLPFLAYMDLAMQDTKSLEAFQQRYTAYEAENGEAVASDADKGLGEFEVISKAADTQGIGYYYVTVQSTNSEQKVISVSSELYSALDVGDCLRATVGTDGTPVVDLNVKVMPAEKA